MRSIKKQQNINHKFAFVSKAPDLVCDACVYMLMAKNWRFSCTVCRKYDLL